MMCAVMVLLTSTLALKVLFSTVDFYKYRHIKAYDMCSDGLADMPLLPGGQLPTGRPPTLFTKFTSAKTKFHHLGTIHDCNVFCAYNFEECMSKRHTCSRAQIGLWPQVGKK